MGNTTNSESLTFSKQWEHKNLEATMIALRGDPNHISIAIDQLNLAREEYIKYKKQFQKQFDAVLNPTLDTKNALALFKEHDHLQRQFISLRKKPFTDEEFNSYKVVRDYEAAKLAMLENVHTMVDDGASEDIIRHKNRVDQVNEELGGSVTMYSILGDYSNSYKKEAMALVSKFEQLAIKTLKRDEHFDQYFRQACYPFDNEKSYNYIPLLEHHIEVYLGGQLDKVNKLIEHNVDQIAAVCGLRAETQGLPVPTKIECIRHSLIINKPYDFDLVFQKQDAFNAELISLSKQCEIRLKRQEDFSKELVGLVKHCDSRLKEQSRISQDLVVLGKQCENSLKRIEQVKFQGKI
ncbi:hypothetical protein AKO1_003734 [Acrasis kona]|uniref:Uncharacterized protein n=1 Tax=Acrasis kona TaxID=1008807 RepID=A0AAW2Z8J7_9EUKA